jgi:hypothetical protein
MAAPAGGRSLAAMTLPRLLTTLAVLYLAGIVLALTGDVASLGGAILNGSKLNAPLVIIAAQLAGGVLLLRGRRAGGVLLLAACTLSLAAVASDGDLGAQGLSAGQVAYQLAITAATAVTWVLAVVHLRRGAAETPRSRRSSASVTAGEMP